MNIDIKIETEKVSKEIINGAIDQACYDYENILGNYHFLTSSRIERSYLNIIGTHLARHARKKPEYFLEFCKMVWSRKYKDGRGPLGMVLASLESIDPDTIIPEVLEMCRDASNSEDVDTLVSGFEPIILRKPETYFPLLKSSIQCDNIWVKRLIIITVGHMMFRYKTRDVTSQCLEIIRPAISDSDLSIRKVAGWIIGSYGVRADQHAVANFISSFAGSEDGAVVWTFAEAFRRSKITLQPDIAAVLIPLFSGWSNSEDPKIKKNAEAVLAILKK